MKRDPNYGLPRRALLGAVGWGAFVLPALFARRAASHSSSDDRLVQPVNADVAAFIARAFEMRRQAEESGDQGYGAVIVRDGKIVGQSQSLVVLNKDPTAHAEMEAIRDAARRLGSRNLSGCTMYSSSSPCPMCEAAAYWANIENLVYGRGAREGGSPRLC